MNALIHSFDRIEPGRPQRRLPRFLRVLWAHLASLLRSAQARREATELAELSDRMLRDIGLKRGDVARAESHLISDARWLLQQWRPREHD